METKEFKVPAGHAAVTYAERQKDAQMYVNFLKENGIEASVSEQKHEELGFAVIVQEKDYEKAERLICVYDSIG